MVQGTFWDKSQSGVGRGGAGGAQTAAGLAAGRPSAARLIDII